MVTIRVPPHACKVQDDESSVSQESVKIKTQGVMSFDAVVGRPG
jgi:hypothetical protein